MECQIRLQGPNVRATREVQSSEMKLEFEEDKVSDGFQKWIPIVLVKEAFGLTLLNAFVIGAVAKCYTNFLTLKNYVGLNSSSHLKIRKSKGIPLSTPK